MGDGEFLNDVACRGSWMLGTACGRCERCRDEASTIIPKLMHYKKTVDRIARLTDPDMPKSHTFKLAVLEEIGRMVSEKI